MDWDGIRYFVALAEAHTLADAAAALGVSDATVMRRIQSLENSLRTTLFVRGRSGHELTPTGEMLLPAAIEMRTLADGIRHDHTGDNSRLSGNVLVTTTEYGADLVIGPALSDFCRQHPDLSLTIHVSPDHLNLSQPDPCIALRFQRPERGPYVISKLGEVSWAFYVARLLADELGLSEDDVVSGAEPFIGWAPPVHEIRVARHVLLSFPNGSATISVPSIRGHLEAARAGLGVALIPRALGDPDASLIRVRGPEPPVVLEAWLVQLSQYRHLARVRAVAAFIKEVFVRNARGEG